MARPKKISPNVLPEAITEPKLTSEEIHEALQKHIDYGVKLRVDDKYWYASKGKLSVSGSLNVPLDDIIFGADYLVGSERFVRAANRKDSQGRRAIGDVLDKDGNDITNG